MTENNDFFINNSNTDDQNQQAEFLYEPKAEPKKTHIPIIILLVMVFIMISALTVYCIYTDIQIGSIAFNSANNNNNQNFSMELYRKPDSSKNIEYTDENGKYTTEGLAEYIRPQVVEIYAYNSKQPDTILASGSGIIISKDGYIVTNTHVIDGTSYTSYLDTEGIKADKFFVRTYDDKQFEATIAGRDTKTDIAVIKIDADGLPCATFGNSDDTVLGEQVAAIGNPAGLTGSISDGIVSGLNRKIKADTTGFEMNCIQTNAAISPGNSGGALVNMYGQVIGITSSKYVNSSYEGLGFAITINEAKPIIEELINNGYVGGRIKVGITFYSADNGEFINEVFKEKYKRDMPQKLIGLWITDISPECDVANTELKKDDFILSVNGKRVTCYDDLNAILEGKKAGDVLKAECARIDKDMKISYFEIEFKLMEDKSGNY